MGPAQAFTMLTFLRRVLFGVVWSRPGDASGTQTSPRDGGDNLGSMLLDAERQKASLQVRACVLGRRSSIECWSCWRHDLLIALHCSPVCAVSWPKPDCTRACHDAAVTPQEQLDEARAEITALQKQLMKAMKATAFAPMG